MPTVSVPKSTEVVPLGKPVRVSINVLVEGVLPEVAGKSPPFDPPAHVGPEELQISTVWKLGSFASKTAVGKTVEVVEIPVPSGVVSNAKFVSRILSKFAVDNEPCWVVFVRDTLNVSVCPPLLKTKLLSSAVAVKSAPQPVPHELEVTKLASIIMGAEPAVITFA